MSSRAEPALAALRRPPGARPWVLGHRGARHAAPENTLRAFELALREGAVGVELDVRLDGSGRVIVLHDPGLARVTGGADHRLADQLGADELGRVVLAGGERVPALRDVLAWSREQRARVNVELKGDVPDLGALVRAVIELVRREEARPELVWFSSFHPWLVRRLSSGLPEYVTCWLFHRRQSAFRAGALFRLLGATGVHPEHVLVDDAHLRLWSKRGALVNTWTVNEPAEARRLAELGVDGIISDHPAALLAAL